MNSFIKMSLADDALCVSLVVAAKMYVYKYSLTTFPCAEIVKFLIFQNSISRKIQIEKLAYILRIYN